MQLRALPSRLMGIQEGPAGTRQTLLLMAGLVQKFKKNLKIRQLSLSLVQALQGKDWLGEIEALFEFVRQNIRYVQDINDVETLQWPTATLKLQAGDCDDMAVLLATMLETIGYVTRFVAIGFQFGNFDHVYIEALVPDLEEWVPLDPTENEEIGWSATGYVVRMEQINS